MKRQTSLLLTIVLALIVSSSMLLTQPSNATTPDPHYNFPCYYDFSGFMCNYLIKEENFVGRVHHVKYGLVGDGNPDNIGIDKMTLNIERDSLVIDITTDQNGTLALALPKHMIQAVNNQTKIVTNEHMQVIEPLVLPEEEVDFRVSIDGKDYQDFKDWRTEELWECCDENSKYYHPLGVFGQDHFYRVVEINFPNTSKQIEVIGNWISDDPRDFGLEFCRDVLCPYDIHVGNQTFTTKYKFGELDFARGNITLNSITPNFERNSIVVNFTVSDKLQQFGVLDMWIPAKLLQPFPSGEFSEYRVFIDGELDGMNQSAFTVGFDKDTYYLSDMYFNSTKGTREIEIVGLRVVPEFGSTFIVATVAIAILGGVIVVSGRYRIGGV